MKALAKALMYVKYLCLNKKSRNKIRVFLWFIVGKSNIKSVLIKSSKKAVKTIKISIRQQIKIKAIKSCCNKNF